MAIRRYLQLLQVHRFKINLKLGLSAIGKQYIVTALSRNILTCLYSNTTSTHFQLDRHQLFKIIWPTGTILYQIEMSEPMPSYKI